MKISKEELLNKYGITLEKGKYKITPIENEYKIDFIKDDTLGCILLGEYDGRDNYISGGISKGILEMFIIKLRKLLNENEGIVFVEITNDFLEDKNDRLEK